MGSLIVSGRRWQAMYKIRRPPGQNFFCSLSQSCFRRGVIRLLGSSFRRLRYILDSGIKVNFVNFSRLCCTSLQGRIGLVFTIVGWHQMIWAVVRVRSVTRKSVSSFVAYGVFHKLLKLILSRFVVFRTLFKNRKELEVKLLKKRKRSGQRWRLRCQREFSDEVKVTENSQAGDHESAHRRPRRSTGGPVCVSLRGRRLKGKGKGVLGARETRGAREEGGRETPARRPLFFSFLTSTRRMLKS